MYNRTAVVFVVKFLSFISSILSIPFILDKYGISNYGVLVGLLSFVNILATFDGGFANQLNVWIPRIQLKILNQNIKSLYKFSLTGLIVIGFFIFLILTLTGSFISKHVSFLVDLVPFTEFILLISAGALMQSISNLNIKCLLGYGKSGLAGILLASQPAFGMLILVIIETPLPLNLAFLVLVLANNFVGMCSYCFVNMNLESNALLNENPKGSWFLFLKNSSFYLFLQLSYLLGFQFDIFLSSLFLPASELARLSIVWRYFMIPLQFSAFLFIGLQRTTALSIDQSGVDWLKIYISKKIKSYIYVGIIIATIAILAGPIVVTKWTHSVVQTDPYLLISGGVLFVATFISQPISAIMNSSPHRRLMVQITIISTIGNLVLSVLGLWIFRNISAPLIASAVSIIIGYILPILLFIRKS